jgi:hypothetical protein
MHQVLTDLPEIINKLFDVLELLVVRLALLGLAALGAYALLCHHL